MPSSHMHEIVQNYLNSILCVGSTVLFMKHKLSKEIKITRA